ncbi:hypothetical protein GCM10009850_048920 [Nonomuraea monospora]|uniref:Uncharacterized protein n=1 Tax=Nonomuraea monospora TaxID=568818 RepID=A0ABN3CKD7_9ACTN
MTARAETSSDARTPASSDYCLAVRRVGRTTQVQLCDLTCPERLALMSAKYWCDWKYEVGQGLFKPEQNGDQMTIPIHDRAVCKAVQHVFTSALAYEVFQRAAKDGRFDGLRPVEVGHKYGPWIWAGGVMDEAQVKALNEVP